MNAAFSALCLTLALLLCAPALPFAQDDAQPPAKPATSTTKSKDASKDKDKSKDKAKSKDKDKKKSKDKDKDKDKKSSTKSDKPKKKDKPERSAKSGYFRGVAWGSPLSAFPDMTLLEDTGALKYYSKPGDDMQVEGVPMREIAYAFCQGGLAGVLVRFDGELNRLQFMGRLGERLGTPLESPPNPRQDRSWRFTDGKEDVIVEYSTTANTGAAAYSSIQALTPCMAQ